MRLTKEYDGKDVISFGPFLLFVTEGILERRVPVHLSRRSLEILRVLIECADEVVGEKNLVARVGRGHPVSQGSLRAHVAGLRKALGVGRSEFRYMTDVPGRGYCFVSQVSVGKLALVASSKDVPTRSAPARTSPGGLAPWQERRAKEIIDANLGGDVSLAELARECGLSTSHFARAFRRTTGTAPHQWLLRRRVEKARHLLGDRKSALSEVALACGFADQSHFTRVFAKISGTSPGAWRRRFAELKFLPTQS
jgi:AraC-like DNA-binding protein